MPRQGHRTRPIFFNIIGAHVQDLDRLVVVANTADLPVGQLRHTRHRACMRQGHHTLSLQLRRRFGRRVS